MEGKLRVIGVGNLLLGDDGVGVYVIHALEKHALPAHVELIDAGTAGIGLVPFFMDVETVFLIDAVDMQADPGTYRVFRWQDVRATIDELNFSLHETRLPAILAMVGELSELPEILIFGIQPQCLDWGMELSPTVASCVPNIVEDVMACVNEKVASATRDGLRINADEDVGADLCVYRGRTHRRAPTEACISREDHLGLTAR